MPASHLSSNLNRKTEILTATQQGYLSELDLGYDLGGNLTWQQEAYFNGALPNRWLTLSYDGADRLANQAVIDRNGIVQSSTYTYDAANNRQSMTVLGGTTQGTTSYSYNLDNQLTGWSGPLGTGTYGYNANGSRTSGTDTQPGSSYIAAYGYDGASRLISVTQGGASYQYAYDYRSRRIARTEAGIGTTVTYSGGTSLAEYTASAPASSPTVQYIRGSDIGGGIGGILYTLRNGGTQMGVTHYNGRGDVVSKTDQSGNLSFAASYDANGSQTQKTGSTLDRQTANTKDQDPTGLIDDGMRYTCLDGGLRVFMTKDPAGFVDGPNVYTYVRQNPWSKFDPEGLEVEDDDEEENRTEPAGVRPGDRPVGNGWYRTSIGNEYRPGADGNVEFREPQGGYSPAEEQEAAERWQPEQPFLYTTEQLKAWESRFGPYEQLGRDDSKESPLQQFRDRMEQEENTLNHYQKLEDAAKKEEEASREKADVESHHIMTNKNNVSTAAGGPYTPKFEELAEERGINLKDEVNKMPLPGHQGPHPAYNAQVYQRLQQATSGLSGDAFNQAFDNALQQIRTETATPGSALNKLATGG